MKDTLRINNNMSDCKTNPVAPCEKMTSTKSEEIPSGQVLKVIMACRRSTKVIHDFDMITRHLKELLLKKIADEEDDVEIVRCRLEGGSFKTGGSSRKDVYKKLEEYFLKYEYTVSYYEGNVDDVTFTLKPM